MKKGEAGFWCPATKDSCTRDDCIGSVCKEFESRSLSPSRRNAESYRGTAELSSRGPVPLLPGEGLAEILNRGIDPTSEGAAHLYWIRQACNAAMESGCRKKRCGAVLVEQRSKEGVLFGGSMLSVGFNGPPQNDSAYQCCGEMAPSLEHPKADRTCCVHAEVRALTRAHWRVDGVRTLYYASVDVGGRLLPSGRPYCVQCSKFALDCHVDRWVLWHEEGPRVYEADHYHWLSRHSDDERLFPGSRSANPVSVDSVRERAKELLAAIYGEFEAGAGSGGEVWKTWQEGGEARALSRIEEALRNERSTR